MPRKWLEDTIRTSAARPPNPHAGKGAILFVVVLGLLAAGLWIWGDRVHGWLFGVLAYAAALGMGAGIFLMQWQGRESWRYAVSALPAAFLIVLTLVSAFQVGPFGEMPPPVCTEGPPVPYAQLAAGELEGSWSGLGLGSQPTQVQGLSPATESLDVVLRYEALVADRVQVQVMGRVDDRWVPLASFGESVSTPQVHNVSAKGASEFYVAVQAAGMDPGGRFHVDWAAFGRNGSPGMTCWSAGSPGL
jgi:hypothetical protein